MDRPQPRLRLAGTEALYEAAFGVLRLLDRIMVSYYRAVLGEV